MRAERRFGAMGTVVHLITMGAPAAALDRAVATVEDLEARWSRFRADSELSRLNRTPGRPVVVSPATAALVAACVEAWHATAGRFDPTVLPSLVAHGYDRSFEDLTVVERPVRSLPAPGCAEVRVDLDACTVLVPEGVALDAGGIAKGLVADWVVSDLMRSGAAGACANLGGDLRVSGVAPEPDEGWVVSVQHEDDRGELVRLALDDSAVATSSTLRRSWRRDGVRRHHLIDPRTGDPAITATTAATVVAPTALLAEVLSKVLVLAPEDEAHALLREAGASAVVSTADGTTTYLEALAA